MEASSGPGLGMVETTEAAMVELSFVVSSTAADAAVDDDDEEERSPPLVVVVGEGGGGGGGTSLEEVTGESLLGLLFPALPVPTRGGSGAEDSHLV